MSYLRGPLSRDQIKALTVQRRESSPAPAPAAVSPAAFCVRSAGRGAAPRGAERPVVPPE